MVTGTVLVVITTNASDTNAIAAWLDPQFAEGQVVQAAGYYAAVSAIERRPRAVVIDLGFPEGRDDWRLAELRPREADAAVVVVAAATPAPRPDWWCTAAVFTAVPASDTVTVSVPNSVWSLSTRS